jgi:hypothetical protein
MQVVVHLRTGMLGTGKEKIIGVGVGIGKRRFKGSNKVQTRLTALVQKRKAEKLKRNCT